MAAPMEALSASYFAGMPTKTRSPLLRVSILSPQLKAATAVMADRIQDFQFIWLGFLFANAE